MIRALTTLLLLLVGFEALAGDLIMIRSQQKFPETMLALQTSIAEHGYKVTRVQRIDIGLTMKGYKTDKYRVVFVGKAEEFQHLISKYPVMAAYMPPKVSIFAEGDTTMLVTADPMVYADFIEDEEDRIIFKRWRNDVYSVFSDVAAAE